VIIPWRSSGGRRPEAECRWRHNRFRGAGLASRTGHTHPRQRTPARGDFYGRYSNVSSGHVAPSATS